MRRPRRTTPTPRRDHRRPAAVVVVALLAGALAVPSAWAEPAGEPGPTRSDVRDARAAEDAALDDVAGVRAALSAADAELEEASAAAARASEAYNGARWRAQEARRDLAAAKRASAKADQALDDQRDTYRRTLVSTVGADLDLSAMTALFEADGVSTLLSETHAVERVQGALEDQHTAYVDASTAATEARDDAATAATTATDAAAEARSTRDAAATAVAAAEATSDRLAGRKAALTRRLARLQGVTVALVTERADRAEAARRARAEAEARRARQAAAADAAAADDQPAPAADDQPAPAPTPETPETPAATPPPSSGGAAAAVAFARAQIGEPYVWAAAGPSAWDCSGLTMAAWQQGGKSLPHYSVAQYEATTPIGPGDLRPGDLVFWGDGGDPSSIYHVALYVGDGRIVHAPRTGRPVTEESLYYWRAPDFYGRP